jgi:diguanylate cyclase (GGDEF)-like protein
MKVPAAPSNEESRLQCLRSINILDTPPEERFDRYTRLAKRVLDVPIALVSLVDEDRQWFKSIQGLDVTETSREVSFCGHAILDNEMMVVNNALHDERFADNPLVLGEPGIRFYAGCPLQFSDGSNLGTLCVIDTKSRVFSEGELDVLSDIAALVMRELEVVQMAVQDELTGISNRRGFKLVAQKSLQICYREKIPASLAFFDLNGFKKINDKYGHAEGDRALVNFATLMTNSFRGSDVCARLGGDEFVVFLTGTKSKDTSEIVKHFHETLSECNVQSNRGYNIEFCSGVIDLELDKPCTIDGLLDRADIMMYENKL